MYTSIAYFWLRLIFWCHFRQTLVGANIRLIDIDCQRQLDQLDEYLRLKHAGYEQQPDLSSVSACVSRSISISGDDRLFRTEHTSAP